MVTVGHDLRRHNLYQKRDYLKETNLGQIIDDDCPKTMIMKFSLLYTAMSIDTTTIDSVGSTTVLTMLV